LHPRGSESGLSFSIEQIVPTRSRTNVKHSNDLDRFRLGETVAISKQKSTIALSISCRELKGIAPWRTRSAARSTSVPPNDTDVSAKYPAIAKALALVPDETMIDGEIVALEAGRPSFNALTTAPTPASCSSTLWT
jgi:hypothetical protein